MPISLSTRVERIKPSLTMAVTERADRLKAEGHDVIGLGAGEPDFDTPACVADAGVEAIRAGMTRYTAVGGTRELKDAIITKFRRENGLEFDRGEVMASTGAKQVLYNVCMALLNPGDEAIIPAPYWVSYPDMVLLADATPVVISAGAEQFYKIGPLQLDAAITPRTRLVFLNSPCNPTGAAYSRAELTALGEVLAAHPQVVIATDDIYEQIWWGPEPFCSLVAACPWLRDRTVTINGVSKSHAMTGWRIGYCAAPAHFIAAMSKIQGQSTSNPCSVSQNAARVALEGDQSVVAEMRAAFQQRHDYVVGRLNRIPGFSCLPGWGTFYAFANIEIAMRAFGIDSDVAFTEKLLEDARVAVVPGSGFGAGGHVRLSYACSLPTLERALDRIARFMSVHQASGARTAALASP